MPVDLHKTGGMTITGKSIEMYRLLALKGALKMLIKTGMKMTRGPTAYAICKREFGFKGTKEKVLAQLEEKIASMHRIKVVTGVLNSQWAGEEGQVQIFELEEWESYVKRVSDEEAAIASGAKPPAYGSCVEVDGNDPLQDGSVVFTFVVDSDPSEELLSTEEHGNGRYLKSVGPMERMVLVVDRYYTPHESEDPEEA